MKQEDLFKLNDHLRVSLANLHTVMHMVESEQPCNQILRQIGVVQQSLRELRCTLILRQIRESMSVIQNDPDAGVRLRELARLQELYREKIQTQFLLYEVKP